MLRLAWKSIRSHRLRLALTVVTVALGIAFIAGTNIFTASLRHAFDSLVAQPRADVSITPQSSGNLPSSLVATAANLPGAQAAEGLITADGTYVLDNQGEAIGAGGAPARGRSWLQDSEISPVSLTVGRPPESSSEVALLTATAQRAQVGVGQQVKIDTPMRGVREFTVVGLVDRGLTGGLGGTLAVFSYATAQDVLSEPGTVSAVLIKADAGVSQEALAAQAKAMSPPNAKVETGQQNADQVAQRIQEGFAFFSTFLLAFGVIALFVSTFLIFNTFSMIVVQRSRELAFLRAVGASRLQVSVLVLVEAAFIGLIAAALGLFGGVGVSMLLRALLARLGADLPAAPLTIEPSAIVLALAVGLVVTVVAALLPARRASMIPPVAAMRASTAVPTRSLRRVTLVGLVLLLLAVIPIAVGLRSADSDGQVAALSVGVGALIAILGVIAITPVLARPVVGAAGWLLRRGLIGRLARLNAIRNPRRTAATASALTIGLALMTAVSVIGASARSSVEDVVDSTIGADFILAGPTFAPFSPDVYAAVQDTPATDVVTYVRAVPVEFTTGKVAVTGVDPDLITQVLDIPMVTGSVADLALGAALVDADTARDMQVAIGSTITGTFVNGQGTLRVVGTFEPAGPLRGVLTSLPTLATIGSLSKDNAVYITLAPGAAPDAVRAEIDRRLSAFPSIKVQDQADIKQEISGQFNVLFGLVYALLGLSVLVAFLGIVNTLSLSVIERTRELGLLRAVGMSRQQVQRLVVWEALLLAILGTAIGLGLGLVFGILFQRVLAPQGITSLTVPVAQLLAFIALAMLGGLAASVWPSWRASRMPVLTAIASD